MTPQISEAIENAKRTLKVRDSIFANGCWYGIRQLFVENEWREKPIDQHSYYVFAEDDCGNEYLTDDTGRVYFWDHETDALIPLSESLVVFLSSLVPSPEVNLKSGQVKRVWVDPSFKPKFD
jgi:hypothetical protein